MRGEFAEEQCLMAVGNVLPAAAAGGKEPKLLYRRSLFGLDVPFDGLTHNGRNGTLLFARQGLELSL